MKEEAIMKRLALTLTTWRLLAGLALAAPALAADGLDIKTGL